MVIDISSPQVGGVRDDDVGARLHEAVGFKVDLVEHRPELVLERLDLLTTAIDTLERSSRTGPVNLRFGVPQGPRDRHVSPVPRFDCLAHISPFSRDIAYSGSPAASLARAHSMMFSEPSMVVPVSSTSVGTL